MPTPQQLHDEITTGPLATTLAPLVTAGNDAAIADSLNAKSYAGYVPISELAAYCCKQGITGGVMALMEIPIGATDNPPTSLSVTTKGMLHTVMTLVQIDFRLEWADVNDTAFLSALDGLISLGVMTSTQKAAVIALGNNRQSRAEVAFGWGTAVSLSDVSEALRGTR